MGSSDSFTNSESTNFLTNICYFFFNWQTEKKTVLDRYEIFWKYSVLQIFFNYRKNWLFIEKVIITWKLFFLNLTTTPIYWNPPFLHPCSFTVRRVIAKSFKFIIVSETFFQGNLLNNLLILIIIRYFSIHNLINYLTFFNQIFSSVENLFEIFVIADWHQ